MVMELSSSMRIFGDFCNFGVHVPTKKLLSSLEMLKLFIIRSNYKVFFGFSLLISSDDLLIPMEIGAISILPPGDGWL